MGPPEGKLVPLARCLLLAGNCLPYHQPEFLATKDSKKALGLSRFLFTLPLWDSVTFHENSLGCLRSGFSGWNFLLFEE